MSTFTGFRFVGSARGGAGSPLTVCLESESPRGINRQSLETQLISKVWPGYFKIGTAADWEHFQITKGPEDLAA